MPVDKNYVKAHKIWAKQQEIGILISKNRIEHLKKYIVLTQKDLAFEKKRLESNLVTQQVSNLNFRKYLKDIK